MVQRGEREKKIEEERQEKEGEENTIQKPHLIMLGPLSFD